MKIYLNFAPSQTPVHRARIIYAFRLFCAIYGHQPIVKPTDASCADIWISYAGNGFLESRTIIKLGNFYRPRSPREPAPAPSPFALHGESTVLHYQPSASGNPDWLGEIFEWVSCADEYSVTTRDNVGRIRFADSYIGRHKLNARLPYAGVAMKCLQAMICNLVSVPREPRSPVNSVRQLIVNTHDVDFLPLGHVGSLYRLLKYALISLLLYKLPLLAASQVKKAIIACVGGPNILDQLPYLAAWEERNGIGASYFFLCRHRHRRDGNYRITDPRVNSLMRRLERQGMEVGVHGSYTSLDQPDGIRSEFHCLREQGLEPKGGRQHWLRFTLGHLIPALERAGATYDSSLGWSEHVGFRAGACFAFPPYNFDDERPAKFLEIPLVTMDQSLRNECNNGGPYSGAFEVLSASKKYGWGGVSVLWHPTAFGGGQLPPQIAEVFWRLAEDPASRDERWVSASEFVQVARQRYDAVGLPCS